MSETNQLTVRPKASLQLATLIGMDPNVMLNVIRAQCFKGGGNVSDEQLAAFVSIAAEMGVNPLLPGMLYAYPVSGGGIVPMMGPDGVYKKLTENPDVDGWETKVFPEDTTQPPTHATTSIWRKGRERPITYTAILAEWKIGTNPNWNSRPRHMLGMRSLKQAARQIIHGVPYDEDEKVIMESINITPKTREIPRVQIENETPAAPEAKTVEAEVVPPPAKKAAPAAKKAAPPAEKAPEPEPVKPPAEKEAAPADAPEGASDEEKIKAALARDGFTEQQLLAMARAISLCAESVTRVGQLTEDAQKSLIDDWADAVDMMGQMKARAAA